jgi:hypothetical protein
LLGCAEEQADEPTIDRLGGEFTDPAWRTSATTVAHGVRAEAAELGTIRKVSVNTRRRCGLIGDRGVMSYRITPPS